jgi:hypothetical protein
MNMNTITRGLLLAPVLAVALMGALSELPAQSPDDFEKTLTRLLAPTWEQRASSLERLERLLDAYPLLRANPEVHRALATALAHENAYIVERYRRADASVEEVIPYPEGRREYYELLLPTALDLVDHATADTGPLLLTHLVAGTYNPDSRFAKILALKGEVAASAVTALASSESPIDRVNAYTLMGEMIRVTRAGATKAPLALRSQAQFRAALRQGLQDAAPTVRMSAIKGVVAGRDRDALALLSVMARTDPYLAPGRRSVSPIRQLAQEAIETLRK